jgi:hypothetical protein
MGLSEVLTGPGVNRLTPLIMELIGDLDYGINST